MRALAAVLVALVFTPSALAWTTLGTGVAGQVVPSMLVTQAGSTLLSYDSPTAGTITLVRNGSPKTLVTGDASANRTQLLQQPNGTLLLYYPNPQGVARLASSDDGVTWTGPIQTQSHTTGSVESAALLPDGTPLFTQNATNTLNVFRGLNGEQSKNVYTRCCAYHQTLAVDSNGQIELAFYTNADPDGATALEALAGDLTPGTPTLLKPVAEHEAPLVADHSGRSFLAWAPGYPNATRITVVPLAGGQPAGDGVTFRGPFTGGDPHVALAVDAQDRLWAVWSEGNVVHAARSRSNGMHFGATVTVPLPATAHGIAALGLSGSPGSASVVINTGTTLIQQELQPGLTVRVFRTTKKVGKKKVVTRWAQALDDGFAVPTASFRIGGRTFHADAQGKARVRAGSGTASAPGYVGAGLRVR